uniref:Cytohesin 1 n=1 Tax=Junco hyemalis TaxID=40217 RepID=A0A8C5NLF4_JUNHY
MEEEEGGGCVPSDLTPEECQELENIRRRKQELLADIQRLKDEIAEVTNEIENLGSTEERKNMQRNKQVAMGRKKFNMDPKKGIQFLIENDLLKNTCEDIAQFLYKGEGLNKTAIGDYLGERDEFNIQVLHAFVELHEFTDLNLVQALRQFLWSFRLPGEAQKIDRMMEAFAQRYCQCNPGVFQSTDTCYVLSFAIIMLNTSLHNPNVKDKPTAERFIAMNRGINDGGDLPEELLQNLYESIKNEPFKIPEDDGNDLTHTFFNPDREGWLLKLGECRQQGRAGCLQGAMPLGLALRSMRRLQRQAQPSWEGQYIQPSIFPWLGSRSRLRVMRPCRVAGRVSWGILPLGWASPGAQSWYQVWCQSTETSRPLRSPSHSRMWSRPPGASGELPQAACVPLHTTDQPCLTFPRHYHLASRLHMQAACMASLLHPAPSRSLRALAPVASLGTSGGSSARVWWGNGRWQDRGPVGRFPRVLPGVRTPDSWPALGRGQRELPAPCPGVGAHRTAQALLSLTGGALRTQAQVGTTDGVAERQRVAVDPRCLGGQGRTLLLSQGVEGARPCPQQPRSPIPQSHSEPGQSSPHSPAAGPTPHSFPAAARPH